ncbi:MAG: hypothetical protein ACI906_002074 [Candidatus Latescibacterota bacterium]|jgi:hypothetical protein
MMKRTLQWTTFALVLTLAGGLINDTEAQRRGPQRASKALQVDENADGISDSRALRHAGRSGNLKGTLARELSTEQRTAIKGEIDALREAGASAEEITAAVATQLVAAGVELPENFAEEHTARVVERQAQAAQREEIHTLVAGLREEGATREEITAALTEAGFELPNKGRPGHGHGHHGRGMRGAGPVDAAPPATSDE